MELRTVAILLLMATIVVLTSAFGAYQDGIEKQKEHEFQIKKKEEKAGVEKRMGPVSETKSGTNSMSISSGSELVGAYGAGTSHKQSAAHLDISEKVDGPYVKDGPNAYRGKVGGYELSDTYNSDSDDDNDSNSDDDEYGNNGKPATEFQKKIKYIKTIFKEIFSKWGSQETIMAPISVEEDPDNPLGGDAEGFKIREKFKKGARQGMRKLRNAFRGRFK